MTYTQLVPANVNITEKAGFCLQFSRRVFGLPPVEPIAWTAWERTQYKHADRNFPEGVSFPVWFDWWGDLGNGQGRQRYGHVAIKHTDGKVYSSPLTGRGRAWFATVDDLCRAFGNGMKYVGWSEDISGTRVIKEVTMDHWETYDEVYKLFKHYTSREPSEKELNDYKANDKTFFYAAMADDLVNRLLQAQATIKDLQAQSPVDGKTATQLKPGLYEVK